MGALDRLSKVHLSTLSELNLLQNIFSELRHWIKLVAENLKIPLRFNILAIL